MNGASSKKEKRRAVQTSHTSKKSKQQTQKTTKDNKKKPPPDSPPRHTKYLITGQRILDPVSHQLTQGLSPSSSTLLEASPVSSITRKKASDNSYNRARTPITVVGYTGGYPRGLHIIGGNNSPQPLTLAPPKDWNRFHSSSLPFTRGQDLFSPERLVTGSLANTQKPWTDLIEEGLNAGKAPSEVLKKLEDSPRTKLDKALAQNLANLRNNTAGGPGTSLQKVGGSSRTEDVTMKPRTPLTHPPVAPWRDISAFQSPNEQRRKAFNSFRLTSPDPPKTPMTVASRQGLSPSSHVTTTLHARHREKQFYDPYSSSPAFSTTNGPDRDLAFMATSSVTAAILKPTTKRKKQSLAGKSVTGLSLNSRINEEMIRVKKTPSQTSTPPGRMVKRPNTQDVKNRDNYFPPPHSANNASPQGQNNRFGSVLHTSPVAVPTTKRMEPTRNVLTPGYNAHSAASARVEARERYSNSMHPTTQKLTPMAARGNGLASPTATTLLQLPPSMPGPTNNTLPSTITTAAATTKQLKPKTPLMPPVHVPGPKRENIYIGQYDGSDDSDSDTDTVTERTQNNNSRPGTAKSTAPQSSS